MHCLIVEDDWLIARGLIFAFQARAWSVQHVSTVQAAQSMLATEAYDVLVLDLNLPDGDGIALLNAARSRSIPLPTVIITARDTVQELVRGLDAGADDYIAKPFQAEELMARVRAVLRRSGRLNSVDRYGGLERRPDDARFFIGDEALLLTPREHTILDLLWRRGGRLVTREELLQTIDPAGNDVAGPSVDVYVHRLRKRLEGSGVSVVTLRGFGYLLKSDEPTSDAR